jgi:hypothetical protein
MPTSSERTNQDLIYLQLLAIAVQLQAQALSQGRHATFSLHIKEAAKLFRENRDALATALSEP